MLEKQRPDKEKTEARRLQRYRVACECQIETGSGTFPGLLTDLSPIGARVETEASAEIGEQATIKHPDSPSIAGLVVRIEDGAIALEFEMNAESVSYAFKALTKPMLNAAKGLLANDNSAAHEEPSSETEPDAVSPSEGEFGKRGSGRVKPILKLVVDPVVKAAMKTVTIEPGQKLPLGVRVKAWWEGYDAEEMQRRLDSLGPKTPTKPKTAKPPREVELPDTKSLWEKAWTEQRIKAAELIWGEGFCGPGGPEYIINLSKRLSLTPEMSMLALGAGMGGPVRTLAKTFGVWIEGLEGSMPLAEVGQEMSVMAGLGKKAPILHYDMETLPAFERTYDRVLAKESMFTIGDKATALLNVEQCLKNGGLFLMTDYLLKDQSALESDDVQEWIAKEPVRPFPATAETMEEMIHDAKFSVRVSEDITEMHQSMITDAWSKTETVMPKLAEECKDEEGHMFMDALLTEAEIWSRRVRLMSEGKLVAWRFLVGKKKIVLMSGW